MQNNCVFARQFSNSTLNELERYDEVTQGQGTFLSKIWFGRNFPVAGITRNAIHKANTVKTRLDEIISFSKSES